MRNDLTWSPSEKKLARSLYDAAVQNELSEIIVEFKARAAAISSPADMWELEDYLRDRRTAFDYKYDYRYSRLIITFGGLLREGRVRDDDLQGLSEEKRQRIHYIASMT